MELERLRLLLIHQFDNNIEDIDNIKMRKVMIIIKNLITDDDELLMKLLEEYESENL